MKQILAFFKSETILSVAWVLALASMFLVPPSASYLDYVDDFSLKLARAATGYSE